MVINFWCLALLIISNVCGGMHSIYVNSRNSTRNNSGFSIVTTRSLAQDLRYIADLSSRVLLKPLDTECVGDIHLHVAPYKCISLMLNTIVKAI